jgi:hypothetical protein
MRLLKQYNNKESSFIEQEDVRVRVEAGRSDFLPQDASLRRARCLGGTDQRKPVAKKRDKTKKRASPEKQRKTKTKQSTEAEGLLLNRQKAWTCGLA